MSDPQSAAEGVETRQLWSALGLLEVAMLGGGAAMGVSVFSVLAPAAKIRGSGILVSAFVAAVPMAVFAVVYAFMATFHGSTYVWAQNSQSGAFVQNTVRKAWITDLELQCEPVKNLLLTLGADNLFNPHPNHTLYSLRRSQLNVNSVAVAFSNYPTFSPYGFDGGVYFGRLTWSF